MDYIPADEFLAFARTLRIAPDERYGPPHCLSYVPDDSPSRFWTTPPEPRRLSYLIGSVLDSLDPWSACYVWPRDGWQDVGTSGGRLDPVCDTLLTAAGVRRDFDGAIRFPPAERAALRSVLFASAAFGWCVSDDLFAIPDHGRQLVHVDHDGAVHVAFADGDEGVDGFVGRMRDRRLPLPTEVPNGVFRRPDWMS